MLLKNNKKLSKKVSKTMKEICEQINNQRELQIFKELQKDKFFMDFILSNYHVKIVRDKERIINTKNRLGMKTITVDRPIHYEVRRRGFLERLFRRFIKCKIKNIKNKDI